MLKLNSPEARAGSTRKGQRTNFFPHARFSLSRYSSLALAGAAVSFAALLLFGTIGQGFATIPILRSGDLAPFAEIHRLVIVFPGDAGKEKTFSQEWSGTDLQTRMERRSLLVFQVVDRSVIAALRKKMAQDESGFHVWLAGMNGTLLFSTDRHFAPSELFARIDALPGRETEIRHHNDWEAGSPTSP